MEFRPEQLKGVVISMELEALELAVLSGDTVEAFIDKNINGDGVIVDAAAIAGGFSSAHLAELAGNTIPPHPDARAALQASSTAFQYLDISSLLQVGFLHEEGEQVLMSCDFKVRLLRNRDGARCLRLA
jgi:hypothetical protein